MISVPLALSLIASVGVDRIGPASAIAVMLQSIGGPLVLVAIQVASRRGRCTWAASTDR